MGRDSWDPLIKGGAYIRTDFWGNINHIIFCSLIIMYHTKYYRFLYSCLVPVAFDYLISTLAKKDIPIVITINQPIDHDRR